MLGPIVVLFSPSSVHWLCMYFPNWRGHFLIQICQKILIWKSIHPIGNAKKNNEPWKEKGCHGLQTFEECENFHKQSILHKIDIGMYIKSRIFTFIKITNLIFFAAQDNILVFQFPKKVEGRKFGSLHTCTSKITKEQKNPIC